MNISSTQYSDRKDNIVIVIDGITERAIVNNMHYVEIKKQVKEGTQPSKMQNKYDKGIR